MKIALGTTSPQKIELVEKILKEFKIPATIEAFEVSSGISDQPITDKETKKGSINRAKEAIELSKNADLALGIEVGYNPISNGDYEIFCWTTLIDQSGKQISVQSQKLLLPSFHQQILKENKYLGDYVAQYVTEATDPASLHMGIIIRDRKPFIKTAVKFALANYFVK